MAHPDLLDEMTELMIEGFDRGTIYARIDARRGLLWQHDEHGGRDDAIGREQLLIASVLQQFIDNGGVARWEWRGGVAGIRWTDENQWQALSDIGVNKKLGFYSLAQFPEVENDAAGY